MHMKIIKKNEKLTKESVYKSIKINLIMMLVFK